MKRAPQRNETIAHRHQKSGCCGKRRVVVVQPDGIGAVVEKAINDGDRKPQGGVGIFGNEGVDRVEVIKAPGMVAQELMALVFRQQDVFRLGETQPMAHWRRPPGRARRAAAPAPSGGIVMPAPLFGRSPEIDFKVRFHHDLARPSINAPVVSPADR